jgi:hypothetical protein
MKDDEADVMMWLQKVRIVVENLNLPVKRKRSVSGEDPDPIKKVPSASLFSVKLDVICICAVLPNALT